MDQVERVKKVYRKRADGEKRLYDDTTWNELNPSVNFLEYHFSKALFRELAELGLSYQRLGEKSVLDMGCGWGRVLRRLVENGAEAGRIVGMDLMDHHLELAKRKNPAISYVRADSRFSPFRDETFDLVLIFTVFSAVIDPGDIRAIAREALRTLKPEGAVIVYDAGNPSYEWTHQDEEFGDLLGFKGIKPAVVKDSFEAAEIRMRKILIHPTIVKALEIGLGKSVWLVFKALAMSSRNKLGLLSNLRAMVTESRARPKLSAFAEMACNALMATGLFRIHYIATVKKKRPL
jgi:ubiquinone/menaquinone biosynthesis C-methylase UbiE